MNTEIKIFVTGGTFDKEYNEVNGQLYFKNTHLYEMLDMARGKVDLDIETLMMRDSLDMNDSNRQYIVNRCRDESHNRIMVTHGTDKMVQTAKAIAEEVKDKTIVLTGAIIPYKFGSSDGLFNLGSALSFVQTLPAGVYIAMNGNYFHWDNVKKNKKLGIFETIH